MMHARLALTIWQIDIQYSHYSMIACYIVVSNKELHKEDYR